MRVLGGAIALFVSLPLSVRGQEVGIVAGRVTDGSGVQPVAAADVLEGETAVADFSLEVSAVALDAVVATATGRYCSLPSREPAG